MNATLQGGIIMSQLSFMNICISKEAKRQAEKLMARYKVLDAIIESKKLDLEPSVTQNYQISESQRVENVSKPTESLVLQELEIEEYVKTKRKLTLVYNSLKPTQQDIWEMSYLMGHTDTFIYNELEISDRTYYRLKKEMVAIVAEAFGFVAEKR